MVGGREDYQVGEGRLEALQRRGGERENKENLFSNPKWTTDRDRATEAASDGRPAPIRKIEVWLAARRDPPIPSLP